MTFQAHFPRWMFVWLSCLLAVSLPTAPLMACWVQEEVRSETNDPVEKDPTEVVDDVALSHSRSELRRTQRLAFGTRTVLKSPLVCLRRFVLVPLAGQVSLWGRSPPLHC